MVGRFGRWLSFWDGLFSGAMLVVGECLFLFEVYEVLQLGLGVHAGSSLDPEEWPICKWSWRRVELPKFLGVLNCPPFDTRYGNDKMKAFRIHYRYSLDGRCWCPTSSCLGLKFVSGRNRGIFGAWEFPIGGCCLVFVSPWPTRRISFTSWLELRCEWVMRVWAPYVYDWKSFQMHLPVEYYEIS